MVDMRSTLVKKAEKKQRPKRRNDGIKTGNVGFRGWKSIPW